MCVVAQPFVVIIILMLATSATPFSMHGLQCMISNRPDQTAAPVLRF